MPWTIREERPGQPDIMALLAARDAYMAELYPAESNHALDLAGLMVPAVTFLVARQDGLAVGCVAVVRGADGFGELKSMWVDPACRGGGLGRALLATIEAVACRQDLTALRLETGIHQPEALGLYRTQGYGEIGPFGHYRADPLSVFMAKPLGSRQG